MLSPDGELLWEATLYHQERYDAGMSARWVIDSKSSSDAPRLDARTTEVLATLIDKTLATTHRLNSALRRDKRDSK